MGEHPGDLGSLTTGIGRRSGGILAAILVLALAACSPLYVVRAGLAEWRILRAREPLAGVILDPDTPPEVRDKLLLAREARTFAAESLGFRTGDIYTTYADLPSDTLALVLSAAPKDRLEPRTWWFPVVGHLPYRGFFDEEEALREQAKLEAEGLDTYLRPTSAFSTLGWFSDPIPSSLLEQDQVGVVESVLHELAHAHVWVDGHVRFNESWASFAGRAGAAEFFCSRRGGGPDTVWCRRARERWSDAVLFSGFMDGLVADLRGVYGDSTLTRDRKLERREEIFAGARRRFRTRVQPAFRAGSYRGFLERPLNNATLLARMRYYHRLYDFQALLEAHGGNLRAAVAALEEGLARDGDPFRLLPSGPPPEVEEALVDGTR